MLKKLVTTIILFICLTTVAPVIANSQGRDRIEVDIPFSFVLRQRTLPAGKYVMERTDPSRPNILTLTNIDKSVVRVVLAQRIEKNNPSTASSLVFIKREGKLYLFQVWNVGSMNGAQVPSALDKQTNDRRRSAVALCPVLPHCGNREDRYVSAGNDGRCARSETHSEARGDPVSLSIPDPISAIARTFRRTGDRAYRVNLVGPFFGPLLSWHPSRNASSLPVLARGRVPPGHSWPLDCTDTSIEDG